jgi:hypothetical protein
MTNRNHSVILFPSTQHALHAERVLQVRGLAVKLIPVPRHLSSDCGVCIRIAATAMAQARSWLNKNKAVYTSMHKVS